MRNQRTQPSQIRTIQLLILGAMMTLLFACSSEESDNNYGAIKFYNASSNSPEIFFTIDEDLEDEDEDAFEATYSSIGYGETSPTRELEDKRYFLEFSWQSEDSSSRDDLTILHESQVTIEKDQLALFVLDGDINSANVLQYNLAIIDDDNDDDEELFNLSILNLHDQFGSLQLHASLANETFNEAMPVSQFEFQQLSDNQKLAQEEYIFYLTLPQSNDVLFQSDSINFPYANQYLLMVKPSNGYGESDFSIDILSWSSFLPLQHYGETGQFRVYNGIETHELLEDYTGQISASFTTIGDDIDIESLQIGNYSEIYSAQRGDYSIDLVATDSEHPLLSNHLVTLSENAFKTVFFYLSEENVDHDGDGDVDEDGDGYVDETEIKIQSMVVENNLNESLYQHHLQILNLVNNDDYPSIRLYFVRSDELIETASYWRTAWFATPTEITLTNNTYEVYAVAQDDSSDIILASELLVLDQDSPNQFILLERDDSTSSGYRMTFTAQNQ
ncbi:hypothetical protein FE810_02235 [Thalassotalea litorea]|uniref:DUF4397 domain-containing protein n=1 Tax=Thalassotalea litorea TaxID=2020715 RepID=A0A5R9INK2_9GAMM|nr:hypothetical protein [Thalassotalea litorea]TLU67125.1 hypothetical protein FE810_02235 [Thalassotalea litorea]